MVYAVELTNLYEPLRPSSAEEVSLVAMSLVRNEADIVSSWMSHICSLFDIVYIVDHASSDGTREFLLEIATMRPGVHLYSFAEPGYFQAEITNQLAQIAARQYPNSWLFPLDADEFLAVRRKSDLVDAVQAVATDRVLRMHWRNCAPIYLTIDQEFTFRSPYLLPPQRGLYQKVAIHSQRVIRNQWKLHQGNHEVIDGSRKAVEQNRRIEIADLLHIPLRSCDQFLLKCVQGYQAYQALPAERKREGQGFHWDNMISKVTKEELLDPGIIREFAVHYGQPDLATARGTSIYSLIDSGWVCGTLDVAHIQPWPAVHRKKTFLQLADEIISGAKGTDIEKLAKAVKNSFTSATIQGENGNKSIASEPKFEELVQDYSIDTERQPELATLCDFISKAFLPHENPLPSTWESHVPFLFSVMHYTKPRRFVELGTHHGNSFFAACQVSREMNSITECIAIDTWRGDRYTGSYGEEIFQQFKFILDRDYRSCGKYIRESFDKASYYFEQGSIDILHIDGLHTYEAVSEDWKTWLPKMSSRGIVMFHDIEEYQNDFGVWRLWKEIKDLYPSFSFEHGHGLGVLLVGASPPGPVLSLFKLLGNEEHAKLIKCIFSDLGRLSPILAKG